MNSLSEIRSFLLALKQMGIEDLVVKTERELKSFIEEVKKCNKCRLAETRTHVVFGEGKYDADIMFIGEAPGEEEDREGRPFVGKAGRLLTRLMEDAGLKREESYICNVLKCRPPNNRDPEKDEIEACKYFLFQQINFVKPKVIVTLGRHAYNTLFETDEKITRIRGEIKKFRDVNVLPTYHPSFLLRNESKIKEAMEDFEKAKYLLLRYRH
ncbi:MAG: uracil-DNA glycosylase [Deltaproteobacteria bacterium]|nr:uracil-DNA glycosylase [Deltaproteobacteria bacterium]